MFVILDSVIDKDVATAKFACDLNACHGACCTMPGGRGAPLENAEVKMIREATPAALPYLSERNRQVIAEEGPVEGRKGDQATRCIDDRDCVFVYYDEQDIARCAIERAYFNGETSFRKPLSCHLFPVRVTQLFDGPFLRYEQIDECAAGRRLGQREGIPLYIFLKDALTRAFGEEFYKQLVESIEKRSAK